MTCADGFLVFDSLKSSMCDGFLVLDSLKSHVRESLISKCVVCCVVQWEESQDVRDNPTGKPREMTPIDRTMELADYKLVRIGVGAPSSDASGWAHLR